MSDSVNEWSVRVNLFYNDIRDFCNHFNIYYAKIAINLKNYLSIINDLITYNKREKRDLTWVYNIWYGIAHKIIHNTNSIINPNHRQLPWDRAVIDTMSCDAIYEHWAKFNYFRYMKNKFKVVHKRAILQSKRENHFSINETERKII